MVKKRLEARELVSENTVESASGEVLTQATYKRIWVEAPEPAKKAAPKKASAKKAAPAPKKTEE